MLITKRIVGLVDVAKHAEYIGMLLMIESDNFVACDSLFLPLAYHGLDYNLLCGCSCDVVYPDKCLYSYELAAYHAGAKLP